MTEQLTQAMLQVAAQIAAAGQYQAASAVIEGLAPATGQPSVALLRAKIAAQQGRYEEAITHWKEALSMTPDNQEAQAGIALAQRLAERRASRFYLRANFYYAVLLLVIVGLIGLLALTWFRGAGRSEPNEQTRQLQQAVESLKTIAADHRLDGHAGDAAASADLKLNLPGVTLRSEGREQTLSFTEGLFQGGARLKPEAKTLLSALARQLEPYVGQFSVCVIGHTDDVPAPARSVYRDNAGLAMARALAVVEHLRASASLPASMFTMRGLGEAAAPFPNDAPDGRARNRTVVMRIEQIRK